MSAGAMVKVRNLEVGFASGPRLGPISLDVPDRQVTALLGPSGSGKSTLLRCLNRLHELTPGARMRGRIYLAGQDIHRMDPAELRRRVGMVSQIPTPFAASVFDNVAYGPRLHGRPGRAELATVVEQSLRAAGLWEEVRDRLHHPAPALSGGQQQRLCLARALAVQPQVLLLDEPTSALDPAAAAQVENLICQLGGRYAIVLVTHHLAQARRLAQRTAVLLAGRLLEVGETEQVFATPRHPATRAFLAGAAG